MKRGVTMGLVVVGMLAAALLAQPATKPGGGQPIPLDPNKIPIDPTPRRPQDFTPDLKPARAPRVLAIKLHADWCPICQGMGSLFDDLGKKFDSEAVLFWKMDLTDQRGRTQGEYATTAMGIGSLWRDLGEGKKTGEVVLVDFANKKIVGRITGDAGWEKAEKAIEEALKR